MIFKCRIFVFVILAQLFVLKHVTGQVIIMPDKIKVAYDFDYKANYQIRNGNLDSAVKLFKNQFELLGYYYPAFEKSYLTAAELASQIGDFALCFNLLDTIFSNGFYLDFDSKYFNKSCYDIFRKTEYKIKLDSLNIYYRARRSVVCNEETMRFMSELYYKDQVTRTSVLSLMKEFNQSIPDTLQKHMIQFSLSKIDCENRRRFLKYVKDNELEGFKYNSYFMPILYHTIFVHNLNPLPDSISLRNSSYNTDCKSGEEEFYKIVQPFLYRLVCLGWMNNQTYAEIIDRAYSRHLGYQLYGSLGKNEKMQNRKAMSDDFTKTNIMRDEIGLQPIDDSSLK